MRADTDDTDETRNYDPLLRTIVFVVQTLAVVFLLVMAWEFMIEDFFFDANSQNHLEEAVGERWEYVTTTMSFTALALLFSGWNLYRENTSRHELERKLYNMANNDALTGIPNRTLLLDRINQALKRAHRSGNKVAILFLDLRHFKQINDNHGHETGDLTLVNVASRLEGCLRETDTVARYGGDEFVIVLTDINNEEDDVAMMGEKLKTTLEAPLIFEHTTLSLVASIGFAIYPDDGETSQTLIAAADANMYESRESA